MRIEPCGPPSRRLSRTATKVTEPEYCLLPSRVSRIFSRPASQNLQPRLLILPSDTVKSSLMRMPTLNWRAPMCYIHRRSNLWRALQYFSPVRVLDLGRHAERNLMRWNSYCSRRKAFPLWALAICRSAFSTLQPTLSTVSLNSREALQ